VQGVMTGFTYTVDNFGNKASVVTASGWTGNPGCWIVRKGGLCE